MKFKRIYIEITNVCNKNCAFCAKTSRAPKTMSVAEFSVVVEKIKEHTNQVYFHVMGEPLANPHVGSFLDICEKQGLWVNLNTNGTLLKDKLNVLIDKKALRKVVISLHSFNANENQEQNTDEYLSDVIYCAKKLSKTAYVELRLWALDENKNIDHNNGKIIERLCREFEFKEEIKPMEKTQYTLCDNLFLDLGNLFVWPQQSNKEFSEGFCYALRTQIAILAEGTVVPCCLDSNGEMALGNIFNSSLEEIVNSKRAKNIYNAFTNHKKVEALCKKCNYLQNKNS